MRHIDLEAEIEFGDHTALNSAMRKTQDKYYWATRIEIQRHNRKTFEIIKLKNILEIGCSIGNDAKFYTKFCSKYCGIDISNAAIKKAESLNLNASEFFCADGHQIPRENEEFDCVIVNSVLHHLDLEQAFKEIKRVLKPDGYLIFREPLGTNPLFQLYRKLTPNTRTPDERPFNFEDLALMKSFFKFEEIHFFGFFTIFSGFIRFKFIQKILNNIDFYLSKTPLKYLFWQFSGLAKKK